MTTKRRAKGAAAIEKKNQVLQQLRVQYVPLGSIHPNAYNPNRQSDHDFELLIRSILEDGFTQPIVAQEATHEIIDGEHRWTAQIVTEYLVRTGKAKKGELPRSEDIVYAREHRLEVMNPNAEIPVVFTDMTPEQMRIATLRHNRARGSEDVELSAQVLRDLQELGALDWAQDSLMLDDVELNRLLDDIAAPEALAGDEYTDAWEPELQTANTFESTVEAQTTTQGGSTVISGASANAVEHMRQRQQQMQAAKNDEERQMVQMAMSIYRVSLIFAGEEADLVKSTLGQHPAETLLRLCKAHADSL
jgi:ParB-like chromosome segregation protein Spo0J